MEISQLLQLGAVGAIAVYLVVFLVRDVKTTQYKILESLEKIANIISKKARK